MQPNYYMKVKEEAGPLKSYLTRLVYLLAVQLIAFQVCRLTHIWTNFTDTKPDLWPEALLMGLRFDLTIASYIITPLFILYTVELITGLALSRIRLALNLFFVCCVFLSQLVFIASVPYYKQFGNFLNQSVFFYSDEGGYVAGLLFGDVSYWGFLIFLIAVYSLTVYFLNNKLYYQAQNQSKRSGAFKMVAIVLLTTTFIFLGARGRVSLKSPINTGLSLVSDNKFINSLAINPNFPFWKGLLAGTKEYKVPARMNELLETSKAYLGTNDENLHRKVSFNSPAKKYNVVVLLMESLCLFKMGYYGGTKTYPLLDSIVKESVFFNRFFSSGIHTFNGVFSSVSGFPSITGEQGLKMYTKKPFNGVATVLKNMGYKSGFYTTHDRHFDNMAGFLKFNNFDEIIDDSKMPTGKSINNLGVPDHVMYDEFLKRHRQTQQAFFKFILSSSDHGPWDVPTDTEFKPVFENKEENAAAYADWALFNFFKKAKKESWYANTIFLILGDHGVSRGHTYQMPISYHHIPLIVHCPALLKPDTISALSYQPDLSPTILSLLNVPYTNNGFGQDAFTANRDFIFFTADDKTGAVTRNNLYYFELEKPESRYLYNLKTMDNINLLNQNKNFADSLQVKVRALLESARYIIHKDYFLF